MTASTKPPSSKFLMAEKTYWESLSEKDRQDSVNKDVSRTLGDKTGWAYTGVLKQKWSDEVLPAILLIINNKENYEKVFRKSNTRVTRYCALYMVGEAQQDPNDKPWECAQPTIVTFHPKLRIARKLCKLLKQNECLKQLNLGFGFMCFEDQKIVLTAGHDEWYNTIFQQENLCGLPFWTPCLPQTSSPKYQRATISGVVLVNNLPFLLTAAHVFYPDRCDDGDDAGNDAGNDDEDDDDDDDDSPVSDLYTEGSNVTHTPQSVEASDITPLFRDHILDHLRDKDVYIFQKPEDSQTGDRPVSSESASSDSSAFKRFGYLSQQLIQLDIGLVICPDLDWALVTPDSWKTLKPNKVRSPAGNIINVNSIASNPPSGSAIVVAAGTSGVFETQASGRVNGIILPGSTHMQEIWTIDSCCQTGDCGSLVVDAQHGAIYGMIVATSNDAQESYLVPAKNILDSLKAKWSATNIVFFSGTAAAEEERERRMPTQRSPQATNIDELLNTGARAPPPLHLVPGGSLPRRSSEDHSGHPVTCCQCDSRMGPALWANSSRCLNCEHKYCSYCTWYRVSIGPAKEDTKA